MIFEHLPSTVAMKQILLMVLVRAGCTEPLSRPDNRGDCRAMTPSYFDYDFLGQGRCMRITVSREVENERRTMSARVLYEECSNEATKKVLSRMERNDDLGGRGR